MYKNTFAANKIGMEVFNFKVENLHKGIQLFQANFINKSIFAILELQLIVDMQIFGSNPALILHIEVMTDGTGNVLSINLQVYQLVLFVAEKADDTLQGTFTGIRIFSPYQLTIPTTGFDTALNSTSNCTTNSANSSARSETGNATRSNSRNNGSANNQRRADGNLSPVGQGPGTGFIPIVDRIIHTVDEELVAVDVAISTQSFHIVCIDETA